MRATREQTPRKPRLRECVSCGEIKVHKARDMCVGCYGRWRWQNRKAAGTQHASA
jgi:hypothetical protein